jgi:indolepyruvate ferredoxin oxidoreductase
VSFVDARAIATTLLGNSIAANMFMLGFAYQQGAVPLSGSAIERAIELNGEAVKMNIAAFRWGRRAAHDRASVEGIVAAASAPSPDRVLSQSLDETITRRVEFLTGYQNAALGERYRKLVETVRSAETRAVANATALTEAVARYYFKLLAYKDEYEVARLYTSGAFQKQVEAAFEGANLRYTFHLAPPILGRKDPNTGLPRKTSFGPWMMRAFGMLAKLKGLRGTAFDPFGYTAERKTERKLISDYETLLAEIVAKLDARNHASAVALAAIPEKIRGYGHVKARHLTAAKREEADLLATFRSPGPETALRAAE